MDLGLTFLILALAFALLMWRRGAARKRREAAAEAARDAVRARLGEDMTDRAEQGRSETPEDGRPPPR